MSKHNHLKNEKSPYLLQHVLNPVDWYPWGEEAFTKSQEEDKPIFLSIGYSSCHWCHVMEKESFEDEEVAQLLNKSFVSIKVDREERPDIDGIYMTVAQMITGRGGWPLTIIMTPEKQPFFAATYIPKKGRFGMTGLIDLLSQIADLWLTNKKKILETSEQITSHMQQLSLTKFNDYNPEEIIIRAFDEFDNRFDEVFGGFGSEPKFPSPHNLLFLLRYWKRFGDTLALNMVEKTLQMMRMGGVYDHIGLGFHRYSTDRKWLLPHFEKMIYDQAMLILAYTEAYQSTKKPEYKETAQEIIKYVLRDMTSSEGGFFSAEDADSEGKEGKFYVWSDSELKKLLEDDFELVSAVFNIEETGNFLDESTGEKTNENILHLKKPLHEISNEFNLDDNELKEKLESIRLKLFKEREKRIHPLKDDKILTDWNGLMIAALATAARVIQADEYLEAAERAANFILNTMLQTDGRLLHRFRDGEKAITGNLDDYSFMIWGLLELYESSFNQEYLEKAILLNDFLLKHFWDSESGGFFFTPDFGEKLLIRDKQVYDGAIPSGNSVAFLTLLKLSRIISNPELDEKADQLMKVFANNVNKMPSAFAFLLLGLDFVLGPSYEVIIVGKPGDTKFEKTINKLRKEFLPNKIVLVKDISKKNIPQLENLFQNYIVKDDEVTIYVCQNYVCKFPTSDPEKMIQDLTTNEN